MVVSLLAMLLVAYVLAKGGQMFIDAGRARDERDLTQEEKDRLVGYKAWIRGNGRKKFSFEKGCIDEKHSPMVLFNQKDNTVVDEVICTRCADILPMSEPLKCSECWVVNVDGYLHIEPCDKHYKEPVLL